MSDLVPAPADRRLHAAVFLLGLGVLSIEVVLSRVLAVVMWHHFASLVISLALLGMTVGATWVYLRGGRPGAEPSSAPSLSRAALLTGLSGAGIFLFFWLADRFPAAGYRLFGALHQPYFEPFGSRGGPADPAVAGALLALFAVMCLPFLFGGVFVTAVLAGRGERAGSLYAADMLGAGAGCLAAVGALQAADGLTAILLASVPPLCAALLLGSPGRPRRVSAACLAAVLLLASANLLDPFARIRFVRGRYQPDILHEAWSATARVVVYPLQGSQEEGSWGQSRRTDDRIPPQLGLVVDDTGYTTITRWPENGDLGFMRHNLIGLPYVVRPRASTLVIGPGGGRDLLAALAWDASRVTAVEINPLVVEAVDGAFGDFSGRIYSRPPVETQVAEGRNFLRGDPGTYDVLQASIVYGRLPPSAGAFTLSEDQLYTLEAFREYFGHLGDGGLLSITRFIYEKRILRLVSLGQAALRELGHADARRHLFIAAERGLATILLSKRPLDDAEVQRLEGWCRDLGFQVLYSPARPGSSPFHRLVDPSGPAAGREARFDLSPPTDDRPYFYYLLKPRDFWRTVTAGGDFEFEDRAILIVRDALLFLTLATMALVLLPLALRSRGAWRGSLAGTLAWFGGIALGFIIVEIIVLKSFILYLGHPVLSLSVVLASLLLGAGTGSLVSPRLVPRVTKRVAAAWLLAVAAAVAVFPAASRSILAATTPWSLLPRVAIAVLLLLPLGFLMGIPLPTGIRLLAERRPALIPWAFGVNGAVSVLGAMLALVLALNYGFRLTFALAPLGYLVAAGGLLLLRREP